MINYSEARKMQIYGILSSQRVLNETAFYKKEEIAALKEFEKALFDIVIEREHSSHLKLRNLGKYIRSQAEELGLAEDEDVKYTCKQLYKLSGDIYSLVGGEIGEAKASRSLQRGIELPGFILSNVELQIAGECYEIDFVVINRSGVYAIETKHYAKDAVINELGKLYFSSSEKANWRGKNICAQMAAQRNALSRVITEAFPESERMRDIAEKIKSVMVLTGSGNITDTNGKETILDKDDAAAYINRNETGIELTREEISLLSEAIEKANQPCKYFLNNDYRRIANSFAATVAKIEFASDNSRENEEETPETNESEETRASSSLGEKLKIAAGITALTVAAGMAAILKHTRDI